MASGAIGRAFAVVGRALAWGMPGSFCGLVLGLVAGVIHAPPDEPGDPLANEWYTVAVFFIMFLEGLAGFFIGAGIGVAIKIPRHRRNAFGLALGGAALGLGLVWVLVPGLGIFDRAPGNGRELESSLIFQFLGTFAGLVYAGARRNAPVKVSKPQFEEV